MYPLAPQLFSLVLFVFGSVSIVDGIRLLFSFFFFFFFYNFPTPLLPARSAASSMRDDLRVAVMMPDHLEQIMASDGPSAFPLHGR